MSKRRIDYARLPQARRIVRMYLAEETVARIVKMSGFSDEKIRTVLKACGIKMRRPGRPGPRHSEDIPQRPLPIEITPAWNASRNTCWRCNTRLDVGCRHHPVGAVHAGDLAQGDGRKFASDCLVNLTRAEIA